jgi:hypothetical protein
MTITHICDKHGSWQLAPHQLLTKLEVPAICGSALRIRKTAHGPHGPFAMSPRFCIFERISGAIYQNKTIVEKSEQKCAPYVPYMQL